MAILIDELEIKINNKAYTEYAIVDVVLCKELLKPNELRFSMVKKSLLKNSGDISFNIADDLLGSPIMLEIKTSRRDESENSCNESLSFEGIIFNVNTKRDMMGKGVVINVTAYSPDYLLNDNAHCFSFEKQTLSDIVTKSISDYQSDIETEIKPIMTSQIPYVVQYNETTYQFLSRLAQRYGAFFYYEDGKMVFGKISSKNSVTLHPDVDISAYYYELNMDHPNFSHCCHNYLSYENNKQNAQDSTNKSLNSLSDYAYNHSVDVYKKETIQHLRSGVQEDNEIVQIDESLKAQGLGSKTQMMICHATTNRADLQIGSKITIKEFFDNDDGKAEVKKHEELIVCQITHFVDINGHYENELMAIPADAEYPPYSNSDAYPLANSQRAIVKDNKDPEKLGRIRVQFLWQELQAEDLLSPWLLIAQPHGGDNKGFNFIPEIDEEVMVGFENGNAEKPYVIGTLYHGKQHPGGNWYNDSNDIKAIRTRNGHTIEIHDKDPGGFIRIYDNGKENYILTFSTDDKLIKMQSTGNIEMYAENDIIMHAKNNINMKADKDIIADAGGNIKETAGENIDASAGKNITADATDDISVTAGKNISEDAGKNMNISVGEKQSLSVGKDQTIDVGNNQGITVGKTYSMDATDIKEEASGKMQLFSQSHEQKSDSTMKIDGGGQMDIIASNVKINS